MIQPPRIQYRSTDGGRWRTVDPNKLPKLSSNFKTRIHPDDQRLFQDQISRYSIWVRLDDYPTRGYTTSVQVAEEASGWVITDICISRSAVHSGNDDNEGPWLSNRIVTKNANESGVTLAVLKAIRITEIRRAIRDRVEASDEIDFPVRTETALETLKASMTDSRYYQRNPLSKARLAAAYEEAMRTGTGNRVHEELAAQFDPPKSPQTILTYVREIRAEGYLTSAGAGRAGGAMTDKSREILRLAGDL